MTAMELDHMDLQTSVLQTQFSSSNDTVNNRWDEEWDNENSSARLFERSRIKALAGTMRGNPPHPDDIIAKLQRH
ncbi:hypothetical protein JOQ06_006461 [Pogonophryne albipinna]|uniref:Uncharacterized protein n=1 Tax=Pogonophryne albipinna TaxID=1090488 RepID=A0AAD6A7X1_9TELE|nr:hypothetical protein JOQ06_006461 [Pogonophryne albipinna]